MYEEAETVYYTIKDEDLPQSSQAARRQQKSPQAGVGTSGPPPQPRPVPQSGSRGRVRHGNGASDKQREDKDTSSHTYEDEEKVKRHATSADRAYPGGASGRRGVCSFLRARRSCLAAGIAVLLSLSAVGLAPLTFSNKQEISQLSTTVDALKRDQDDMSATVDALKRDQDGMSATVDTLKRDQDDMSTDVDALKRDQDDIRHLSTTVDALKRDQDDMRQLSTTVDALKRDQEALKRDQDALKRDQDALKRDLDDIRQLSTTVDALKRDLDNERNRPAALEQRLHDIENGKTLASCPEGYTKRRGTCYKVFGTEKTFDNAAAACRADGGTLAMPRDAETNAFLISLYKSVRKDFGFWIGLHDQREEGSYEWVDGSPLGLYNSWGPGEPSNFQDQDCVLFFNYRSQKNRWHDYDCNVREYFICQADPGRP
ncbi:uncharacterized protein LOC144924822 [Branchiostoma floridae x Branchiostoma belcheri]